MASKLRDFVSLNPPTFLGSKVGEDPQAFLDEVYKIVHAMGVSSREKMDLASYQLKEEECRTKILHGDMTLSRLIVYVQSIEESKLRRRGRYVKRGRTDEQEALWTCLDGTSGCNGCGKNDQKVRYCPSIASRRRDVKQAPYNGPGVDEQNKNHLYALHASKEANPNDGARKL
nr:uncharacterized protein LOC104649162 [Solanum lycopersicum]